MRSSLWQDRSDDYALRTGIPGVRALVANDYGDVEALRFDDVAVPEPGDGELLVRVAATSLNPIDLKMLSGALRSLFATSFPYIPGVDVCGTVVATGTNVHGYAVGDRVGGAVQKGLAEFARADAASPLVARVPNGIEDVVAAAAPVVGVTGLEVARTAGDVRGKTVAVIGAGGSVGNVVVQRCAAAGAHVIGTARDREVEAVRAAGAHETIDYAAEPAVTTLRSLVPQGVDVLVDLVAVGDALRASAAAVRPGGTLISTLFGPPDAGRSVSVRYIRMEQAMTTAAQVYELIARGELRIPIAASFAFAEASAALRQLSAGTSGKIVVTFPGG